MSEMLANRYFLAGRFGDAAIHFEAVLRKHAVHVQARKKLILCYALTGRIREALEVAAGLLRDNPDAFLRTDPRAEGFPCDDVVRLVDVNPGFADGGERYVCLGLIHLFCDETRALRELELAMNERVNLGELRTVHELVRRHLEAGHVR